MRSEPDTTQVSVSGLLQQAANAPKFKHLAIREGRMLLRLWNLARTLRRCSSSLKYPLCRHDLLAKGMLPLPLSSSIGLILLIQRPTGPTTLHQMPRTSRGNSTEEAPSQPYSDLQNNTPGNVWLDEAVMMPV